MDMIAKSCPRKVYFAIDGPKSDEDKCLVREVREIFRSGIDGAICEYIENSTNKGPEVTISSAISAVFEKEDRLIILEDDVVAPYSFLAFAEQMLEVYAEDDRIAMISGSNLAEESSIPGKDYFFAYMGNTLSGWATWKRAWNDFNLNEDFTISRAELRQRFRNKRMQSFFYRNYRAFSLLPRGTNTWDSCWLFERIKKNKLSIVPRVNLTSNVGTYGTHFNGESVYHNVPYDDSFHATSQTMNVEVNEFWDEAIYDKLLSTTFLEGVRVRILLVINIIRLLSHEYWCKLQRS